MLPVMALVGRPNVGKSTLFNRLTQAKAALVNDQPGVTRDRLYGTGVFEGRQFLVVDTGGIEDEDNEFAAAIREQVEQVLEEATVVLFLVDGKQGLVNQDHAVVELLHKAGANTQLVINKAEGAIAELLAAEFSLLGIQRVHPVSAKRGDGITRLLSTVTENWSGPYEHSDDSDEPCFAITGRPNVGKSTLANRLSGAHRVIVSNIPGTTRDSVSIPLAIAGQSVTLIDTAGVRRKSRTSGAIEKFSVVKTLQAMQRCHVTLLLLDASAGVHTQDAAIAGMVNDLGRAIVLVINKWDGLPRHRRTAFIKDCAARLAFLPDPATIRISALHGSNVDRVLPAAMKTYENTIRTIATSSLCRTLEDATTRTPPPMHNKRPVRLKFAHQAGCNPLTITVHGSNADKVPASYCRYLGRYFANEYGLKGVPVRIEFKAQENPFKVGHPADRQYKKRSGRRRKL